MPPNVMTLFDVALAVLFVVEASWLFDDAWHC